MHLRLFYMLSFNLTCALLLSLLSHPPHLYFVSSGSSIISRSSRPSVTYLMRVVAWHTDRQTYIHTKRQTTTTQLESVFWCLTHRSCSCCSRNQAIQIGLPIRVWVREQSRLFRVYNVGPQPSVMYQHSMPAWARYIQDNSALPAAKWSHSIPLSMQTNATYTAADFGAVWQLLCYTCPLVLAEPLPLHPIPAAPQSTWLVASSKRTP